MGRVSESRQIDPFLGRCSRHTSQQECAWSRNEFCSGGRILGGCHFDPPQPNKHPFYVLSDCQTSHAVWGQPQPRALSALLQGCKRTHLTRTHISPEKQILGGGLPLKGSSQRQTMPLKTHGDLDVEPSEVGCKNGCESTIPL